MPYYIYITSYIRWGVKFVVQIVTFNVDYVTLKMKTQCNSFLVKASCTCLFGIACINVQLKECAPCKNIPSWFEGFHDVGRSC